MTNAELIAKIKAEIERLKEENKNIKCKENERYCSGYDDAFYDLLSFLDTLEEPKIVDGEDETELNSLAYLEQLGYTCIPPDSGHSEKPNNPEGLDEAAMEVPMMASAGRILDEQFQDEPDEICQTFLRSWRGGFKAGAEWDREQMMKEAVEYEVWDFSTEACPHVNIPLDNKQYRYGDKVRIIIVKED